MGLISKKKEDFWAATLIDTCFKIKVHGVS